MKAVIFDMDGTLLDSVEQHARAWQDTLRHFGHDIPLDEVRHQIGKGGDQLLPVFLSPAEIEQRGKEIEQYRGDLFKRDYLPQVKPFAAVRALFERVRAAGMKPALATSSKGDELAHYKELAGIADLVEEESSKEDAAQSKPHPDIFASALKKLELPAAEAIAVGDAPYDAEAAGKLGLRTIGLLGGGFSADELRQAGAEAIYQDAADLLARFDESPLGHR